MKELELMDNGNIKVMGVSLGEHIGKAMMILSSYGINPKKRQNYVEGKGNIVGLNMGVSLSFVKECSLQIDTEWTGKRVNEFKMFWKPVLCNSNRRVVDYIKKRCLEWGLKIGEEVNDNKTIVTCENDVFELYLNAPEPDGKNYTLLSISLKHNIQNKLSGDYDYQFITDLYMEYLDKISQNKTKSKSTFKTKIKEVASNKKLWFVFLLAVMFPLIFGYAYINRYDTFKDKHTYMRYDKWKEVYEKYDIPSKKWIDAGRRNGY